MQVIVNPADTKAARNVEHLLALYEGMINDKRAAETVPQYVAADYIQHNPSLPDGPAGLAAAFSALNATRDNAKVTVHRVVAVDDWVFAHVHFFNLATDDPADRGTVGVDIFRFSDDGHAAEHWDVLQPVIDPSEAANTNGQI